MVVDDERKHRSYSKSRCGQGARTYLVHVLHEGDHDVEQVHQRQAEETQIHSLLEAVLEEDQQVQAVGGETDEEESRNQDGSLYTGKKIDRRAVDDVIAGVVENEGGQVDNQTARIDQ